MMPREVLLIRRIVEAIWSPSHIPRHQWDYELMDRSFEAAEDAVKHLAIRHRQMIGPPAPATIRGATRCRCADVDDTRMSKPARPTPRARRIGR